MTDRIGEIREQCDEAMTDKPNGNTRISVNLFALRTILSRVTALEGELKEARAEVARRECPDCGFELRDNQADFKKCEEVEAALRKELAAQAKMWGEKFNTLGVEHGKELAAEKARADLNQAKWEMAKSDRERELEAELANAQGYMTGLENSVDRLKESLAEEKVKREALHKDQVMRKEKADSLAWENQELRNELAKLSKV